MIKKSLLILNTVLVIVALAIFVDIFSSLVRARQLEFPQPPPPPLTRENVQTEPQPYDYYCVIAERNLFALKDDKQESLVVPAANLSNLKLKGTIIREGWEPFCIIELSRNRKEEVYKKGDLVEGNQIVQIDRDRVILKTSAGLVSLAVYGENFLSDLGLEIFPPVKQIARNQWSLSRSLLATVMDNPAQLLAQLSVTSPEAGEAKGIRIDNVTSGSLAESLGIKGGDIIREIEGRKVDSIENAIQIYQEVLNRPMVKVEIERNGRPMSLFYEIKD
jgi:type II secretion system protein C